MIPANKLKEGLEECLENSLQKIRAAKILHEERHYHASIPLSLIADEENAKAAVLGEHLKRNEPISDKEWKRITRGQAHTEKFKESWKLRESIGISVMSKDISRDEGLRNIAQVLQSTKEMCLYVDWHAQSNSWISPLKIFAPVSIKEPEMLSGLFIKQSEHIRDYLVAMYLAP